jgi:peroxiredoxin
MSGKVRRSPVRVGRAVPDFCLPAATGGTFCLRDFLNEGSVLLWFYRGHW